MEKPIHIKPSLYAYYFLYLKEIALKYGYNLVLHGSLNRDLDLIAIPWQEELRPHDEMIEEFIKELGGTLMFANGINRSHTKSLNTEDWPKYSVTHHGRMQYVINVNRECDSRNEFKDKQFYLDISVVPSMPRI